CPAQQEDVEPDIRMEMPVWREGASHKVELQVWHPLQSAHADGSRGQPDLGPAAARRVQGRRVPCQGQDEDGVPRTVRHRSQGGRHGRRRGALRDIDVVPQDQARPDEAGGGRDLSCSRDRRAQSPDRAASSGGGRTDGRGHAGSNARHPATPHGASGTPALPQCHECQGSRQGCSGYSTSVWRTTTSAAGTSRWRHHGRTGFPAQRSHPADGKQQAAVHSHEQPDAADAAIHSRSDHGDQRSEQAEDDSRTHASTAFADSEHRGIDARDGRSCHGHTTGGRGVSHGPAHHRPDEPRPGLRGVAARADPIRGHAHSHLADPGGQGDRSSSRPTEVHRRLPGQVRGSRFSAPQDSVRGREVWRQPGQEDAEGRRRDSAHHGR
ncbi:unnamed protein product, partial [Prorocentrum cordatum]